MDLTKFIESLNDPNVIINFTIPPPSPTPPRETEKTKWSWHENKLFENALGEYDILDYLDTRSNVFEDIASKISGKTIDDVKQHYKELVEDIELIESNSIPLSDYETTYGRDEEIKRADKNKSAKKALKRKPKAWSKEEHEKFLYGLERYGKGDWKSISRFIRTRSSTQIASHAQKYFLKLEKASKSVASSENHVGAEAVTLSFGAANYVDANANALPGSLAFYPHNF